MIGILDYGVGNIRSYVNIYTQLNIPHMVVKTPEELKKSSKIILPGVGSFDQAMSRLLQSGMTDLLSELVLEKKTPVLGVCIGMHLMTKGSDEGQLSGLGWINGYVKKIKKLFNESLPIPHMGWNNLIQKNHSPLNHKIEKESKFYFLHSYYVDGLPDDIVIAEVFYGNKMCAVFSDNNIYGMQCHPEKSHSVGVQFLKNFSEIELC
jgi:imidazole glycerol-phosphate synthase subunit HisH